MRIYDIITKKRDGEKLSKKEIEFVINGYTTGDIADYQMSALLMAIFINGMSDEELVYLTEFMMNSGDTLDLSEIGEIITDKHSTGGVGDKITIPLSPLVASAGVKIAMLSGRGLGHTGGTLDKFESIPGMNVFLTVEQFLNNIKNIGLSIMGQTQNLAPADKKIYALRDATATVNSIPLIASSIMSKKLASGANVIVMDVKTGSGAFMSKMEDALKLGKKMINIGNGMKRNVVGIITNMNQPLGEMVGNANEIIESIEILKNKGPEDVRELTLTLGAFMVKEAGKADSFKDAYALLEKKLEDGSALEKFKEFVKTQNGNPSICDDYSLLPKSENSIEIKAEKTGYIKTMNTYKIGAAAVDLGAGRQKKEDDVDHSVGFRILKKQGDFVKENETIAVMDINNMSKSETISKMFLEAVEITEEKTEKEPLIYYYIDESGAESWESAKKKI